MKTLIYLSAFLVACSGPSQASHSTAPTEEPTAAATATATAAASTVPTLVPTATADAGACPDDMALVDGDYCEDLEVECIKKWEAPQNNLWVCEEVKQPTRCVGKARKMRYCIDRYEFPNRKGERPMVMQNFYQAQMHCAERGKRVCTESEWTKACEGPDNKPFPYGYTRDPKKCQGNQPWDHPNGKKLLAREPAELERLWQGVVSGSQPECISDYGVHDMPGNADELAASETYGKGPKSDYDNVTTGGPWYIGVRNMCRPKIYSHDESFAYYYLSWRCCAEADGKATEPRAPKQLRRAQKLIDAGHKPGGSCLCSWDNIVWIGTHSWKMPFNPLVPGDEGYSSSGPRK